MNSMNRRSFITAAGAGAAMVALGKTPVFAADDDQKKKAAAAIKEVTGGKKAKSGNVKLIAPTIAENGSVVPITVEADGVTASQIALLVDENPTPIVYTAKIGKGAGGMVSARIRMRKTSEVRAYVTDTKGNVYSTSKMVKVTIGGCG